MKKEVNAEILKIRAGKDSEFFVKAVREIYFQLENLEDNPRLLSSYRLWKMVFDLNIPKLRVPARSIMNHVGIERSKEPLTNDKVKRLLYSLQSYYVMTLQAALINKICYHVKDHPSSYRELIDRFSGILHGIELMPFSCWHSDVEFGEELFGKILELSRDINEWPISSDVVQAFYEDIIGNPFRKALGEFYTRDWIVNLILDSIGFAGKGSILDPGCGSGIFLTNAIYRIIKSNRGRRINSCWDTITQNVVGFDLNPVAVVAAKLNYFLSLSNLIPEQDDFSNVLEHTNLPLFWTNSIIWNAQTKDDHIIVTSPIGVFQVSNNPSDAYLEVKQNLVTILQENSIETSSVSKMAQSFISPLCYGPFDYVVGNPPWVAPERMNKEYRDHIAKLLENSGYLESYRPRIRSLTHKLPSRQFSAALPFFATTFRYFLKEGGTCGFLVTSSLLKSLNAGGFRKRIAKFHLKKLIDLTPYTNIHEGAMCWAFIPIVVKQSKSQPVTEYHFYIPTTKKHPQHEEKCTEIESPNGKFHVCSWKIQTSKMRATPSDDRSPWFSAPPRIISIYRKILDSGKNNKIGNLYPITRGIVTGSDRIYVVKSIDLLSNKEKVNIKTGMTGSKGAIVESELIFPFIQGKHVEAWSFDYTHIILPYDIPSWKIKEEQDLRKNFPLLLGYLLRNKPSLENRRTQTIRQRMKRGQDFYVIEPRTNLGKSWVLAIKGISTKLETCVIPPTIPTVLGKRPTMLAHTLNYIPFDSKREAHYLSAILNSWLVRAIIYDLGMPKGGYPFKRYDMWMIGDLPIPQFDLRNNRCKALVELAHRAHEMKLVYSQVEMDSIERKVNEIVTDLYGISTFEFKELKKHYDRLACMNV